MQKQILTKEQCRVGRSELGWSQQELAKNSGVGVSTVADFERGRRLPNQDTLLALLSCMRKNGIVFHNRDITPSSSPSSSVAQSSGGTTFSWITATDIVQWADRRDAESTLPELIRRLLLAETGGTAQLQFPSGESIRKPGWDGRCSVAQGTAFVPTGTSGWEISCQDGVRTKAEKDYSKRTRDPEGLTPNKSTFVYVTPRRWNAKHEWVSTKKRASPWGGVRAYDADDLAAWVERYPAVARWLAVMIGKPVREHIHALDEVWKEWSLYASPPLDPSLIIASRAAEVRSIQGWLDNSPSVISVCAESTGEAVCFLYAALRQLPPAYMDLSSCRCLVASDSDAARNVGVSVSKLIIVLERPDPGLAQSLAQRGHHVYVACTPDDYLPRDVVRLGQPNSSDLVEALHKMGLEYGPAFQKVQDSSRSPTLLRRLLLSRNSAARDPGRAAQPCPELVAAVFAGAWDERYAGDKSVLQTLANSKQYNELTRALTPLASTMDNPRDKPLFRVGETWKLRSRIESWEILKDNLTKEQIEAFENEAVRVLTAKDPRFSLDSKERWQASAKGVNPEYSESIREGISQTLALLSIFGAPSLDGQSAARVNRIVKSVLKDADKQRWWSLSEVFRPLAEAAPEVFLEQLESSMESQADSVMVLFKEDEGPTGRYYGSNLLWALESLAWSPDYFPRVAILIAKLAREDPGGTYSNRPLTSLISIFHLLRPQTDMPYKDRLAVLDQLRKKEPGIAWKLMACLLSSHRGILTTTVRPRWRSFDTVANDAMPSAFVDQEIIDVSSRLLEDTGSEKEHWNEILRVLPDLPPSHRQTVIKWLLKSTSNLKDTSSKRAVCDAIRGLLHHNRSHPTAYWAMPECELVQIEKIYSKLEPKKLIEKYAWLFQYDAQDVRPSKEEHQTYQEVQKTLEKKRIDALRQILSEQEITSLCELAHIVGSKQGGDAYLIGTCVAQLNIPLQEQRKLLGSIMPRYPSVDGDLDRLAAGVLFHSFSRYGKSWGSSLLRFAEKQKWGKPAILRLLLYFRPCTWTWKQVELFGDGMGKEYWKHVRLPYSLAKGDLVFAIKKLLSVNRPLIVIDLLGSRDDVGVPSELIIAALKGAVAESTNNQMFAYHVVQLFKQLDGKLPQEQISALEWQYLQVLDGSERPPRALEEYLASSPDFFASIIKTIYRSDQGVTTSNPSESEIVRAQQAYRLLRVWKRVPGTKSNGDIDLVALKEWVLKSRQLCASYGRAEIGDVEIGNILAAAPIGADGIWPHIAVREVLELVSNPAITEGILSGVINRGGVSSCSIGDEGKHELDLAQKYLQYSKATAIKWRKTSAILTKIKENYLGYSRWQKELAEKEGW